MNAIEWFGICIGWVMSCLISFMIGYLTKAEEDSDEP